MRGIQEGVQGKEVGLELSGLGSILRLFCRDMWRRHIKMARSFTVPRCEGSHHRQMLKCTTSKIYNSG